MKNIRIASFLLCVFLIAAVLSPAANAEEYIERFNATAYNFVGDGKVAVLQIHISDWTTAEERAELIAALKESGSEGVVELLRKSTEKGWVRAPNTIAYKMTYAFEFDSEEKRVLVMATNRPVSPNATRQGAEHNLSLIRMEFDKGKKTGTGMMIVGADVSVNDKTGEFEIKTAAREPIRFTSIKELKPKKKK